MSAAAAAAFSSLTARQISSRYTGSDFGAAIPTRTLDPLTSITSTTTSSPSMIFSPGRLVMMSKVPPWERIGGRAYCVSPLCADGRAQGRVGHLVDDLVPALAHDDDGGSKVQAEHPQLVVMPNGGVRRRPTEIADGQAIRLVVGQFDRVPLKEPERIGDWNRARGMVEVLKPRHWQVVVDE